VKYLFLIRVDPDVEPDEADTDIQPWLDEMHARGARLIGDRLRPADEAKAVTVRGNETLVSEGPFTETKELIGGFDVIECADEAEALEIAAKHPVTRFGTVELRACWPIEP
jgi:hypothetical protein